MHILCLGLNTASAPIELREKFAFSEDQIHATFARLSYERSERSEQSEQTIAEMVLLSTCNRIEIYAVCASAWDSDLERHLCTGKGMSPAQIRPHLYRFVDGETVQHLFEVAAGLDSLVIGEPQILGQITRALELARGQNAAGSVLNRLFQAAIHAGKRARTETAISRNPVSVSSLAASVAEKAVADIRSAKVVVLGAGEMAELTVEALRKRGVQHIRVVNRTLERAQKLASAWDAAYDTFEALAENLAEADILISSTGAQHFIISAELLRSARQGRMQRPLVLIDIAVPRDIDPDCACLPGVRLFDIDNLNVSLEKSLAQREAEVPHVREILAEERTSFSEYLRSLEMLPLIVDIRQTAEQIRLGELERTFRHLPNLTAAERARINALTLALVNKLLDSPTRRLRAEAVCPHAPVYAAVTRTLFGMDNNSGFCELSGEICPISSSAD